MSITHISGPCTSCDWIPVTTCENYKNGTFPKCCPNLNSEAEAKLYEKSSTKDQIGESNMEEKKNKKKEDLTLGAVHPTEKLQELGDGTVIRLEDYTTPKSKKEVDKEQSGETSERALRT